MQACIPCGIAVRLNGIVGPIIFQLIELGGQQKQTSSEWNERAQQMWRTHFNIIAEA